MKKLIIGEEIWLIPKDKPEVETYLIERRACEKIASQVYSEIQLEQEYSWGGIVWEIEENRGFKIISEEPTFEKQEGEFQMETEPVYPVCPGKWFYREAITAWRNSKNSFKRRSVPEKYIREDGNFTVVDLYYTVRTTKPFLTVKGKLVLNKLGKQYENIAKFNGYLD